MKDNTHRWNGGVIEIGRLLKDYKMSKETFGKQAAFLRDFVNALPGDGFTKKSAIRWEQQHKKGKDYHPRIMRALLVGISRYQALREVIDVVQKNSDNEQIKDATKLIACKDLNEEVIKTDLDRMKKILTFLGFDQYKHIKTLKEPSSKEIDDALRATIDEAKGARV